MAQNKIKKYKMHRYNAKQRGISWEITYRQWVRIWLESGHWEERGRGLGKYVMARFGDTGPYAPWNVKIILNSENVSEGNLGNKHLLGKKFSIEHRAKQSAANMGKKHTPETKVKMSAAKMGNLYCLGRGYSPETRARMSVAQKKRWQKVRVSL